MLANDFFEKINKAQEIKIQDLNFYSGKKQLLKNVNLSIPMKKTTSLIGPSGSGKSTLIRVFNKIYDLHSGFSTSGHLFFGGFDILGSTIDSAYIRQRVGMVFQKPTPFPMSVYDNVAFALKIHHKDKKRELPDLVEKALRDTALWDEVKDGLHESALKLSGGQQQRLCIARTLALNPCVLLLDEPSSALDPLSSKKIEELLLRLQYKKTIITITHNLKQAKKISDYSVFLTKGQIIESGAACDFFNAPKSALLKDYLESHA